jgi:sarcosine oxidase subunit alpha
MSRLPPQPGERVNRSRHLTFSFDGQVVEAFEGDTIGSALFAGGRRTFSRSFKYHRPRGLMCCSGQCPNCLVAVDGAPGVRACTEPVREGMAVEHLNATPSLDFDVMRATDYFGGPFTPPGFYYKTFIRPRRLWPLYEKVLRHAAGLGVLPKTGYGPHRRWRTEYRRRHCDVVVVGGGAAGLHAAIAAAELGADVVLADEGHAVGGRLLCEGGHAEAAALGARAARAGVEVLVSAPVLGLFDGLAAVWQGATLHQVRARRHVLATGSIEQPIVFENNDLPGVMLSGAARRLIALYGVKPGRRAVVATTSNRGIDAVAALRAAGVEVVAVADYRTHASPAGAALASAGVPVLIGATVLSARGRRALTGVTLRVPSGQTREFACDLLVVAGQMAPATSLVIQAGAKASYDSGRGHFAVEALRDGVHLAGDLADEGAEGVVELSGAVAGREAALAIGFGDDAVRAVQEADREWLAAQSAQALPRAGVPPPSAGEGKCFACLCEDVTAKDILRSAEEGYDSLELAKRYTTVTMGPCQGRMCQLGSARILAAHTGRNVSDVGVTTPRPPWSTVPLGALAGRPFEPAKRSALHATHRRLGATVRWAGDWRRPYDYGDPQGEALAVQTSAGLIDVSTLGKLLVRGPDAGELLDRLYPNVMSTIAVERIRYGVLTSDAGRIMDDGTVCRLDDETFYVTTTSTGAAAAEQWFSWWLADWQLDARITDVTQGIGAMNLAGPRAREVLTALTDLDCSSGAFGYLDARQADVASVPCLLLRIGFVGEVGYEIHCPSAQADHVWRAILAKGAELGADVRSFGLEPQRILRLQKLHVIVGQDTDSESTPYGAAMPWIVKLDKEQDFIGRWALEHAAHQTPDTRLVGFRCADGTVPVEGSVVLHDGRPAGQVTSARWSPHLGSVIGMAWVPTAVARDDAPITISDAGATISATVQTAPFYDPEGSVLRS